MTALAEALLASGYGKEREQLRKIAIESMKRNAGSLDAVRDGIYRETRQDARLLWALFERFRRAAVDELIAEVTSDMKRDSERAIENARPSSGTPAHTSSGTRVSTVKKGGWANTGASPKTESPNRLSPHIKTPEARIAATLEAMRRTSKLDQIIINGMPIGDLTPREANAWADTHHVKAKYVRMLTANLPENKPIRECVDPDYADELWKRASAAEDAA